MLTMEGEAAESRAATRLAARLLAFLAPELRDRAAASPDNEDRLIMMRSLAARRWPTAAFGMIGSGHALWVPAASMRVACIPSEGWCTLYTGPLGVGVQSPATALSFAYRRCHDDDEPRWRRCVDGAPVEPAAILEHVRFLLQRAPLAAPVGAQVEETTRECLPVPIADEVVSHLLNAPSVWDALFAVADDDSAYLAGAPTRGLS